MLKKIIDDRAVVGDKLVGPLQLVRAEQLDTLLAVEDRLVLEGIEPVVHMLVDLGMAVGILLIGYFWPENKIAVLLQQKT